MTARNLQDEVKKKGLPWSAVKGFDTFTPIGYTPLHICFQFKSELWSFPRPFIPKSYVLDPHALKLSLKVRITRRLLYVIDWRSKMQINGAIKQDGLTGDMIFRIPRLIEHVSSIMTLEVYILYTPLSSFIHLQYRKVTWFWQVPHLALAQ